MLYPCIHVHTHGLMTDACAHACEDILLLLIIMIIIVLVLVLVQYQYQY